MNPFIFLLILTLVLFSCSHVSYPIDTQNKRVDAAIEREYRERADILQKDLSALGKDIDPDEARLAAETAIYYSMHLANEYNLVSPPLFHNFLVNLGMRQKGLCFHWADDLMASLRSLKLKSFDLYWGVAYHESFLSRDHYSVVITAQGQPFEEGIVLDAWRNSGKLYWAYVKEDKYPWKSIER